MTQPQFKGIPAEAFDFYDALAADPTRTFWEAHKADYLGNVRGPLELLGAQLSEEFGAIHLFRPYRDVRFSKDKTPYKDHQGMFAERSDGVGWYIQLSAAGLMIAGGWYSSSSEQVKRYRNSVAWDDGSARVTELTDDLVSAGFSIGGACVATRPRGVAADHPHLTWLRHRTLYAERRWQPSAWMGRRNSATKIGDQWRLLSPLVDWLSDTVGSGATAAGTGSQGGL